MRRHEGPRRQLAPRRRAARARARRDAASGFETLGRAALPCNVFVFQYPAAHYSVGRMPNGKVGKVHSHTLAAALALSAQAAGAIHLPIVVAYATLVAASAGLALLGATRDRRASSSHRRRPGWVDVGARRRVHVGAGVWLALALVCLLQVVPLP